MIDYTSKMRHMTESISWSLFNKTFSPPAEQDGTVCYYDATTDDYFDTFQITEAASIQIEAPNGAFSSLLEWGSLQKKVGVSQIALQFRRKAMLKSICRNHLYNHVPCGYRGGFSYMLGKIVSVLISGMSMLDDSLRQTPHPAQRSLLVSRTLFGGQGAPVTCVRRFHVLHLSDRLFGFHQREYMRKLSIMSILR